MIKSLVRDSNSVRLRRFIPLILVLLGLIFIGCYGVWKYNQLYIAFGLTGNQMVNSTHSSDLLPQKLQIPKLGLNLGVNEAIIKDGVWGVNNNGVSHLDISAVPGEPGNVIIYGHDKSAILGNLAKLKSGDAINVLTRNGQVHGYKVTKIITVSPKDVWVLDPASHEQLIVYTCTGFLDSSRLVVYAEPF